MGRPRQFDSEIAVSKFVELFWTNGFERTSVDDLQDAAGIKRGSFYAAFGDKNRACNLAVDRYVSGTTMHVLSALEEAENPIVGLSAFLRFVGRFMADNIGRGCLLFSLCTEREGLPPDVGATLARHEREVFGRVHRRVREAAKAELLPSNQSAAASEALIRAMLFGMNGMARAGLPGRSIVQAADAAARCVESWPRRPAANPGETTP